MIFLTTVTLWSQNATDSLLLQLKQTNSDSLKIKLYIELGNNLSYENPEKAVLYFNQSLQIAKKYNNSNFLGKSHKAIGSFYYEKSDYEEALSNFKLAQIYFEKSRRKSFAEGNNLAQKSRIRCADPLLAENEFKTDDP